MLNIRQVFRVFSSNCSTSLRKSATPVSFEIAKNSSLYHPNFLQQKLNLHTSVVTPSAANESVLTKQPLGRLERKMRLSFTCKRCNTRNTKTISKLSYEEGVVIVRCDGCKNNHLIADNLGWFAHFGTKKNIEHFLAEKGETVRKIYDYTEGSVQILENKVIDEDMKIALESKYKSTDETVNQDDIKSKS